MEMTRHSMTGHRPGAALVALALVVAGCGNAPDTGFGFRDTLALTRAALLPKDNKAAVVITDIPAETLASWPEPLIVATIENTRTSAALGRIARNGANETYASHTGNHLTLNEGVVVATRGLGIDLMSAAAPARSTIAGRKGAYARSWQWLDGLDATVSVTMDCTLHETGRETVTLSGKSYPVRIVAERCSGPSGSVENTYWVDAGGVLRKSRQWLGQDAGHVLLFDPNPRHFHR